MSAGSAHGSTLDALATALEALGLGELPAGRLAADWAVHYPLVSQAGASRVARSLEELGLATESAWQAAGLMLALELQVRGAAYQQALEGVERAGVPLPLARAAAIEAVQLRRQVTHCPVSKPRGTAAGVLAKLFS
jgi:hypothetical protein